MIHTYEVLVDIKEFLGQASNAFQNGTERYEIDADSIEKADYMARAQARIDHPRGTEYDARVTKLIK